ncbi:MAG: hypothetical protein ACPGLR_03865 [Flavobacteriaceae bacterium]
MGDSENSVEPLEIKEGTRLLFKDSDEIWTRGKFVTFNDKGQVVLKQIRVYDKNVMEETHERESVIFPYDNNKEVFYHNEIYKVTIKPYQKPPFIKNRFNTYLQNTKDDQVVGVHKKELIQTLKETDTARWTFANDQKILYNHQSWWWLDPQFSEATVHRCLDYNLVPSYKVEYAGEDGSPQTKIIMKAVLESKGYKNIKPYPEPEQRQTPPGTPLGGPAKERALNSAAWTEDRATRFFNMFLQNIHPPLDKNEYEQYRNAVTSFLTGVEIVDFPLVSQFGEIAFADMGLTEQGFWVGEIQFANNNGQNYQDHRDKAMALFNEAEEHLAELSGDQNPNASFIDSPETHQNPPTELSTAFTKESCTVCGIMYGRTK